MSCIRKSHRKKPKSLGKVKMRQSSSSSSQRTAKTKHYLLVAARKKERIFLARHSSRKMTIQMRAREREKRSRAIHIHIYIPIHIEKPRRVRYLLGIYLACGERARAPLSLSLSLPFVAAPPASVEVRRSHLSCRSRVQSYMPRRAVRPFLLRCCCLCSSTTMPSSPELL